MENTNLSKKLSQSIVAELVGENAFMILGAFKKQARLDGWLEAEIEAVLDLARSGDYDNLIQCLLKFEPE